MRRIATILASSLLLVGTTTACGDDTKDDARAGDPASPSQSTSESSDPSVSPSPSDSTTPSDDVTPTDPTTSANPNASEFCTAATAEGFDTGGFDEIKSWADGLRQVTPPDDLTSEQRQGLELLVGMVEKSKTEAELSANGDAFTPKQQAKVQAFVTYVGTECR